jgi:hypothetical protein
MRDFELTVIGNWILDPIQNQINWSQNLPHYFFKINFNSNLTDWAVARRRVGKHVPPNPHPTIEWASIAR